MACSRSRHRRGFMLKGPIMIIKASQNFWKSVSGCLEFREIPWSKWLRCQIAVGLSMARVVGFLPHGFPRLITSSASQFTFWSSSWHLMECAIGLVAVELATFASCCIHDLKHVCFSTQWLRLNHKLFICGKVHIAWLLQNRWIISQQSRAWWKWKLPSLVLTAAETGERYKFYIKGWATVKRSERGEVGQ